MMYVLKGDAGADAFCADAEAGLGCRAHDLVRLIARFSPPADAPAWVHGALARAPFAVVRRARAPAGFVAVGVRGETRAQRYGCFAALSDIESVVPPEALLCAPHAPGPERRGLPVFAGLASLVAQSATCGGALLLGGHAWGPAGSAGFELATSVPTVTVASDLDLLVRAPRALTREDAASLIDVLQTHGTSFGIRIDAQIDTPAGGVALAEWAAGGRRVLARSPVGPRLVADPWSD